METTKGSLGWFYQMLPKTGPSKCRRDDSITGTAARRSTQSLSRTTSSLAGICEEYYRKSNWERFGGCNEYFEREVLRQSRCK